MGINAFNFLQLNTEVMWSYFDLENSHFHFIEVMDYLKKITLYYFLKLKFFLGKDIRALCKLCEAYGKSIRLAYKAVFYPRIYTWGMDIMHCAYVQMQWRDSINEAWILKQVSYFVV